MPGSHARSRRPGAEAAEPAAAAYDRGMLGSANGPDVEALRAVFTGRGAGQPAGWDGVKAFEKAAGVVLPEPYRSFAALIGDGCLAGAPQYGLVPLHQAGCRDPYGEPGARRERDGDGLAALAGNHQSTVAALQPEVLDVRPRWPPRPAAR